MHSRSTKLVLFSPFIIITVNIVVAIIFGKIIEKWAFIPIILIEWCLFMYFIIKYGGKESIKKWLKKSDKKWGWKILCLLVGILPLPIFLKYNILLEGWTIWLPWLLLAVINPWLEEFYWRGLLSDYTKNWNATVSVFFTSFVFSANHLVFGINSILFRGPEVFFSTLIMGIVWAVTYKKTNSLRWVIFSHFLVDFLNLSVPAFLELFQPTW
ncbi:CPBP family intramembrane glutamic endopeptidase [Empedobacter brevis]|uniref:CPBP family intramembrane glutamic endopeptidase n=1 Tax=Empedobacter brevis TaxID=247 RepID=UPI0023F11FD3|nr:CPBP family intramembrane glutamic endopeptidase [Empedobacter brevis]